MVTLGNKIDIYDDGASIVSVCATTIEYIYIYCTFGSDPEFVFLTDGASKGVMQMLNTIIRNEKDGV